MKELTDIKELNQILNDELVVLLIKTKSCSVCVPVAHQLETVMKDYPEVSTYRINADEVEEVKGQFLVFTVPTILIFSNNKEILRESRFIDFNKIKRLLALFKE